MLGENEIRCVCVICFDLTYPFGIQFRIRRHGPSPDWKLRELFAIHFGWGYLDSGPSLVAGRPLYDEFWKEHCMRAQSTRFLAAAALTGLVAGAATVNMGCKSNSGGSSSTTMSSAGTSGDTAMMAKHSCKSMNDCKNQGGCQTGDNGCKHKNSCKGKGGCDTRM
jgi:hypothetical protein